MHGGASPAGPARNGSTPWTERSTPHSRSQRHPACVLTRTADPRKPRSAACANRAGGFVLLARPSRHAAARSARISRRAGITVVAGAALDRRGSRTMTVDAGIARGTRVAVIASADDGLAGRRRLADLEADDLRAPRTLLRNGLDRSRVDRADARKELPLVGERHEPLVDEHRVSTLSRVVLKRQRDQVAEPAAGKRVLVREEPITGLERELVATSHRLRDQVAAHPPGHARHDRLREEEPDVCPVARARALDGNRQAHGTAGVGEGSDVVRPAPLVEVGSEQPTTLVFEHRIHADHVATLQMIEDRLVAHREEGLIRALPALHSRLLTYAAHPLVPAGGSIATTAGAGVLPVPRVDVGTTTE